MAPVQTAHLFADLHAAFVSLLQSLTPDQWHAPTICKGWTVKDISSHMLDTQLRTLAMGRDSHFAPLPDRPTLVGSLNDLNNTWVQATRRLSPALLIELHRQTGPVHASFIESLDPDAPSLFSVAWAGETQSKNWFHIGRDFTEYWHHQQQIRDAVHAPPLTSRQFLGPVLELFIRAIPHAYRDFNVEALQIEITGEAGGVWNYSTHAGLRFGPSPQPHTRISISAEDAWRLFTNGLPQAHVEASGDPHVIAHFQKVRAVMV
jgi:uncharacterized protein (TIGR03083 family)